MILKAHPPLPACRCMAGQGTKEPEFKTQQRLVENQRIPSFYSRFVSASTFLCNVVCPSALAFRTRIAYTRKHALEHIHLPLVLLGGQLHPQQHCWILQRATILYRDLPAGAFSHLPLNYLVLAPVTGRTLNLLDPNV